MVRTFTGPNTYALKKTLHDIKNEFTKKYGELSLEIIDGEETVYEQAIAAVESVPFLAEKKLVVANNLGLMKGIEDKIAQLVESAKNANELIIVEQKLDKRGAYYKYLKSNTDLKELKDLDERELANWLVEQANNSRAKLGFSDAYYLVQRVGTNQEAVSKELRKLIDYDRQITRKNIDLLTEASPQSSIFNILDSAFGGDSKKALDIYDQQRLLGVEPLNIFGMVVWQMHQVALASAAGNRTDPEIMQSSGMKPFVLGKSKAIASRMGREKIKNTLSKLVELDKMLKTTSVDADEALKSLLLSIAR